MTKALVKNFLTSKFFTASFWVFLSTGILNFGNYLYHLLMGQMLGPTQYGVLESSISLLYIVTIPVMTLSLVIVKYVSSLKGKNDNDAIGVLYTVITKNSIRYALIIAVILFAFSPLLVRLLRLPSYFIVLTLILSSLLGVVTQINRSFLQGISQFFPFSVTSSVEIIGKLAISILFVVLGFKADGAFAAIGVSGILAFIATQYFIKGLKKKNGQVKNKKDMIRFAVPVFFSNLALTSLFTTDVILVRFFFPGMESGYYAALSVLGKVIFFGVSPIVMVMFPFVSESQARGENYLRYLFISLVIAFLGAIGVTGLYFVFPEVIVKMLYGKEYLSIVPLVGLFGLFISLYSLCSLLINYFLAVHKTRSIYMLMTAAVLQAILITLFHSDLDQVVGISILVTGMLFTFLMLYIPFSL